jgi:hypothetical protein
MNRINTAVQYNNNSSSSNILKIKGEYDLTQLGSLIKPIFEGFPMI